MIARRRGDRGDERHELRRAPRSPPLGRSGAVQHRRRRLRQASARQARDDLGELRRLDARARLGRAPGPREPGGAHARGARRDERETASRSSCRRRPRRRRSSSASGSSARSCSRCRCSTATTASSTASPTPQARLLVTDAENAPRFDRPWAPDVLVLEPDTLAAAPTDFICADTAADDPAQLYYTSGTTGLAKGIVHAHRYILAPRGVRLLPRGRGRRALPRDGRVGVGGRHRAAARPVAARGGAVRLPARGRLRPAPAARLPQPQRGHERLHDADGDALDDGDRRRAATRYPQVFRRVCSAGRAAQPRGDPLVPRAVRHHGARLLRAHRVVSARRQLSRASRCARGRWGSRCRAGTCRSSTRTSGRSPAGERGEICLRARSNPALSARLLEERRGGRGDVRRRVVPHEGRRRRGRGRLLLVRRAGPTT